MRSAVAGTRYHLAAALRAPTTVALLFLLPPVVVVGYAEAMAAMPAAFVETLPRTAGRINGALFATAFLTGLLGLFQVVSASSADRRLALCGFDRPTLFATRLATVLAFGLVAAGVSLAALWAGVEPAAPLLAVGTLLLAGLVYGLLGVLVGSVLTRELEGSLVLVMVTDVDAFLSSGVVAVGASADLPVVGTVSARDFLPLFHPHALVEAAVLEGTVPVDHLWGTLGYAAVLLVLAGGAYLSSTGGGGA